MAARSTTWSAIWPIRPRPSSRSRASRRMFGRLDVLVINAGGPPPGRILDIDDATWREAFELLVLGPMRLARLAIPSMAKRGFGRVIVVTSAMVRQPHPDLAISVVLRTAITSAVNLLSREYAADGVTVNCVAPGATDTDRRREVLENRARRSGGSYAEVERADCADIPAGRAAEPARDRRGDRLPGVGGSELRQRHRAHGRRRTDGDDLMAEFEMASFLAGLHRRGPTGPSAPARRARRRTAATTRRPGSQPDHAVDRRRPADRDLRTLPPGDPAGSELGHATPPSRDRPFRHQRRRAQRDRGRDRHVVHRRLHLHAALDLAPALQRLRPGGSRVPHHRELTAARRLRTDPPTERRSRHRHRGPRPIQGATPHD